MSQGERAGTRLDLAAVRARLAGQTGRRYWRSLEELAGTAEFEELLHREFPRYAAFWHEALDRRQFLRLMGASLALAGLTACGAQAREKIVPYIHQPENMVPGKPLYFATAMTLGGFASGLLVESNEGRPTKVEGNPDHPANRGGGTDLFAQASVLTLYDPDRSQAVTNNGRVTSWDAFVAALRPVLAGQRASGGAGLRILTETVTSPTLAAQLQALLKAFPNAHWGQYEPVNRDNALAGARLAFGDAATPVYHFDRAAVVLALDADFLAWGPGRVRYARDFIDGRRARQVKQSMNRLYAVEPMPTLAGVLADHRLALRASDIAAFTRALAKQLGVDDGLGDAPAPAGVPANWLAALTRDLQSHRGGSLVVAGERQPPFVHALAHAINGALGNAGQTVTYIAPVEADPAAQGDALRALVDDLNAGKVEALLVLGGNPIYTAPADLDLAGALPKANLRAHLGLYADETAALCQWHVPAAHELEVWGDARAYDGTASIIQPLIAPLYNGKTAHELLALLLDQPNATSYQLVRQYWQGQHQDADFEEFWRKSVHDGIVAGTAAAPKQVSVRPGFAQGSASPAAGAGLEINFRPDPTIWDGRFANNGWLQETPKPLTKLTWDNAAHISPATAARLGLATADIVELRYQGRSVRAPVWVLPGHADDAVTVTLGYGRTMAGRVGTGAGFNAYLLRTTAAPWFGASLELVKAGGSMELATTQNSHSMEGRDLVHSGTLAQFRQNPSFLHNEGAKPSLYPPRHYDGYAWGMSIDLNACIGCNACMVACQAENNIPIVGKDQVQNGREMHWIRIDRYYSGDLAQPTTYFEPVPCMQCENAPCELVCPVGATVHDSEGLNVMVYNRCVGTRYCSNNCPYKVRRFNFLQWVDKETPTLKLQRNPEVTVRERGVMEKCTYCTQRITAARITAQNENRQVRDGEILTACQQACPTGAIVFGDINDAQSQVSALKAEPLNYTLLDELNTRPRTTYLARLRNPNPELGTE
jgi:MoCo/4Fe-4S cofactor protein with predicted Tat translocation signal